MEFRGALLLRVSQMKERPHLETRLKRMLNLLLWVWVLAVLFLYLYGFRDILGSVLSVFVA